MEPFKFRLGNEKLDESRLNHFLAPIRNVHMLWGLTQSLKKTKFSSRFAENNLLKNIYSKKVK